MSNNKFEWEDDEVEVLVPQCITKNCKHRDGMYCRLYNNIPEFAYTNECEQCESGE